MKVSEVVWKPHHLWPNDFITKFNEKSIKIYSSGKPASFWVYSINDNSEVHYKTSDEAKEACINKAVELGLLEDDREKEVLEWIDRNSGSVLKQDDRVYVKKWFSKNQGLYYVSIQATGKQPYDGSSSEHMKENEFYSIIAAKSFAVQKALELGIFKDTKKSPKVLEIDYEALEDELVDTRSPEERIAEAVKNYHLRRKTA